jgi:hypothetical protein
MKTKKLSKLTIRRLRAIKKQILKEPRQFVMRGLFECLHSTIDEDGYGVNSRQATVPNCGTAACIAGWACTLYLRPRLNPAIANAITSRSESEPWDDAKRLLRADENQCQWLFLFEHWPPQFKKHRKEGTAAFARQAAARIEYFIKTNGTDKE